MKATNASRHAWHQSWVTNRGQLLLLDGRMDNGEMVLQGIDRSQKEGPRLIRGIWKPVKGGVRETAEASGDSGKTWQPLFDIIFRSHTKRRVLRRRPLAALDVLDSK